MGCAPKKRSKQNWMPNFFIRISPDNTITFLCARSEMGQGTSTGLAMIAADELGVDMDQIEIEFSTGSSERYGNMQDTGGSNGIRMQWPALRKAIATTRELLILAACNKWEVLPKDCYCEKGIVNHRLSEKKAAFGELLEIASTLAAPKDVKLKEPCEFKYIGKSIIGPKTKLAATGRTNYSLNLKFEDMLYAAIERCPVWGGRLVSFNDDKARRVPGVIEVVQVKPLEEQPDDYKGGVRHGVAVLASNTWAAFEGKKALEIQWDGGANAKKSDEDIKRELIQDSLSNNDISLEIDEANRVFKKGDDFFSAYYSSPFQANACMEPLNATAYHRGHKIEIWAGTQSPSITRDRISELMGLPPAAITVNNLPSGGGFGRRFFTDYVEEAVVLSNHFRKPVKVTWTREDTLATSKNHPYWVDNWEASLDNKGVPIAFKYKGAIAGPSGFTPFPYGIPTTFYRPLGYRYPRLLPRASWRSVAAHPWGLSLESFIDELAHRARIDPLEFRIGLLKNADVVEQVFEPWVGDDLYPDKLGNTLEIAAEKANWGVGKERGIYQGVSSISYNTSYCTQIVDLSIVGEDILKIHKVTAVVDCGLVINPSQATAQVEGSIVWGLTALLKNPITVRNGRVQQRNFDTYELLKMAEVPEIEVYFVDNENAPTGIGELAVPGLAPAVLNAVYAATGKRIRDLPLKQPKIV
ncbi:xanthine dehydrogenase family protein molybdopterin-binding subunit [Flagellimonas ochracea]|uniref:xanthine dehydrogenase family protein molybdopterin-binding subunit n=1 Tax=Flagellimonas ochracea TaxID=2696472 RepID=UPI002FF56844